MSRSDVTIWRLQEGLPHLLYGLSVKTWLQIWDRVRILGKTHTQNISGDMSNKDIIFCDVTSFSLAEGCQCANVSEQLVAFILRALDRKLKTAVSHGVLVTIYQTAQRHVPGDSNVLTIPHMERNFVGRLYLATIPSVPVVLNDHGTSKLSVG